MISLIQYFEADFLWKVSLKILNSGLILKAFTHVLYVYLHSVDGKVTVPDGLIVGKIVSVCV